MDPPTQLPATGFRARYGSPLGLALGLLTALCGVAVYFKVILWDPDPSLFSLVEIWMWDEEASYGFLIPPLAAYFVWERQYRLRGLPAEGSAWGLALIAVALGLFFVGLLGGINYLPRASAVFLLLGGIHWIGGPRWTRELVFPVLFLLLMIPLPYLVYYRLTFPLQLQSSAITGAILSWAGMPVLREGSVLRLEGYSLEVVTACSGLRSIMTLGEGGCLANLLPESMQSTLHFGADRR